jgi:hypothetical protein
MADAGRRSSPLSRALVVLLGLGYLLPLTLIALWLVIMLPAAFPTGWPASIAGKAAGGLYAALVLANPISVGVLWFLAICCFRRSSRLNDTPAWLWWLGAVSPLCVLWGASKRMYVLYHQSHGTDAALMAEAYWSHELRTDSLMLVWSMMFFLLLWVLRRTGSSTI